MVAVERVEGAVDALIRPRARSPRPLVLGRVVEVPRVAASDAHVHVDRLPELADARERALLVLLLLLLAHHLLGVLEKPALVLDLLLLSVDLLLEPFDELAHFRQLFVDLGARIRRPGDEQARHR